VNIAQRFERQQMSLFELAIFLLLCFGGLSGTSGIAALWLAARCFAGCDDVRLDAPRELETVPPKSEKPAKVGFKCKGLWLLKTHSPEHGRKHFALGSPTNDVLSFPRHFLSLQFGRLGRKGSFSTATPDPTHNLRSGRVDKRSRDVTTGTLEFDYSVFVVP
jgi:hypothetical protein